jgi:signal transduction histidine kinase
MALTLNDQNNDQDQVVVDEDRFNSLMNSLADAVIALDKQLRIENYNAAALNLLDINTINPHADLKSVFQPIDRNDKPIDIDTFIQNTTLPTVNRDYRLKYKDGSMISLYISIAPVKLDYGKTGTTGFVILIRDITREKSLEEERDEFISVVSHELRTPIAISEGNIGNAEFLVEKNSDMTAIKQALSEAHNQVLFLADLINDLSTLSRAERGVLQVEVETININDLIKELAHNYEPQAAKKSLQIKVNIDPQLEILKSSKLYVREILQNFITNALKYTDHGGIELAAKSTPAGVNVSVTDSGIGISKADQARVFEKFFRSEDYRTRQSNGTGLGLYVTMKLAKLVKAEISLDSELNKGSTFTALFPNLS